MSHNKKHRHLKALKTENAALIVVNDKRAVLFNRELSWLEFNQRVLKKR